MIYPRPSPGVLLEHETVEKSAKEQEKQANQREKGVHCGLQSLELYGGQSNQMPRDADIYPRPCILMNNGQEPEKQDKEIERKKKGKRFEVYFVTS